MKTLSYAKLTLFLTVLIGLTSCGDEKYYTDDYLKNSDEKLCKREWVNEYVAVDGKLCKHILIFNENGKGREKIHTWNMLPDGSGWYPEYSETNNPIDWSWVDKSMEGLYIVNAYDQKSYHFDNVWVREHYLSGKLDGEIVVFVDAAYLK